jgi:hypothetical protein
VPAAALWAAYLIIDPHLSTPAFILVTVFAWGTAARAVDGWLHSAPFRPGSAVATATIGAFAGVFAYIGGLSAVETFVSPALPGEVTDPVSSALLVATIAVIALVVAVVWFTPGARMQKVRTRVYAFARTSAPVASELTTRGSSTGVAPVPETRHLPPRVELARSTRST